MKKTNVQKLIAILIIGLLMMGGMESCNKDDNATPNEKDTLGWGNEPINEIITIEQVLSESLYSELSNNSIINPYSNTLEKKLFNGQILFTKLCGKYHPPKLQNHLKLLIILC